MLLGIIWICLIVHRSLSNAYWIEDDILQMNKKQNKPIEELELEFEDEKNAVISVTEEEEDYLYNEFYDEMDNRETDEQSMNMIFYGPTKEFMRLDSETILHMLQHTKKSKLPDARVILAWDLITDGKTAAYLQGKELLAFRGLLNTIPEEDLYYVNFGDLSVLKFFSNYETNLDLRKSGILASAYTRYYGTSWFNNASLIDGIGYLLCGFSTVTLNMIPPKVFRDIHVNTLNKAATCSPDQTTVLYNIAKHRGAYGPPYRWTSYEISRLGLLLTNIEKCDIKRIKLEAISAIKPGVITMMDPDKVELFSSQQIMRMERETKRVIILRMQLRSGVNMDQLNQSHRVTSDKQLLFPIIFISLWIIMRKDVLH